MSLTGKIAFASGRAVDFDLWVLDLGKGTLAQLTTGDCWNDFPRWSPDGKRIAYISDYETEIPSLWVMDAEGRNRKRLTDKIYCQSPSWSPDGGQILVCANAEDKNSINLCCVDAKGGGKPAVLHSRPGSETDASWSPDGKSVVFSGPEEGTDALASRNTEIWELQLATKALKRLTRHPAKDYGPRYSPDGKHIAFISHRNERSTDDYVGKMREVQEAIARNDMKSVNAGIRAIQALEQDADIYVMNRDGSNERALTTNGSIDVGACWSPDGKYLAYTNAPKDTHEGERLKILEVQTGKAVALSYDRGPLEREIGAEQALNATLFQRLIPNIIERRFADRSFWGEERHPDWTA